MTPVAQCRHALTVLASSLAVINMLPESAEAAEPGLAIELSRERLSLPGVQFGTVKMSFSGGGGPVGPVENSDGDLTGHRVGLALGGLSWRVAGQPLSIGLRGFYTSVRTETGTQSCSTPLVAPGPGPGLPFCTVMPLVDPITAGGFPLAFNSVYDTPGETITFLTRRRATHGGAALEFETPLIARGGGVSPALALLFGPTYRTIGHKLDIDASGIAPAGTSTGLVSYRETLTTDYWGGFLGARLDLPLSARFTLKLDGEIGLYRASSTYHGRYSASGATESGRFSANLTQALALDQQRSAVIAALKLTAEQDFGSVRIAAFIRREFYSYVPGVTYNDVDMTGSPGENLLGSNNGTRLRGASATADSIGARVTVPFASK